MLCAAVTKLETVAIGFFAVLVVYSVITACSLAAGAGDVD